PDVITQIENSFREGSVEFLNRNPLNYSPFIDRYNSVEQLSDNRRASRIDVSYKYSADDFSKGFGTTDKVKVSNARLTGTGKDDL
ncbi:hypothetical protein V3G65_25800, partial [Escherichia coli]|uniref:hypothetical protein n=2 Tax=Enterobacteriaceae TaxID=543 RepID=UPI003592F548